MLETAISRNTDSSYFFMLVPYLFLIIKKKSKRTSQSTYSNSLETQNIYKLFQLINTQTLTTYHLNL